MRSTIANDVSEPIKTSAKLDGPPGYDTSFGDGIAFSSIQKITDQLLSQRFSVALQLTDTQKSGGNNCPSPNLFSADHPSFFRRHGFFLSTQHSKLLGPDRSRLCGAVAEIVQ